MLKGHWFCHLEREKQSEIVGLNSLIGNNESTSNNIQRVKTKLPSWRVFNQYWNTDSHTNNWKEWIPILVSTFILKSIPILVWSLLPIPIPIKILIPEEYRYRGQKKIKRFVWIQEDITNSYRYHMFYSYWYLVFIIHVYWIIPIQIRLLIPISR